MLSQTTILEGADAIPVVVIIFGMFVIGLIAFAIAWLRGIRMGTMECLCRYRDRSERAAIEVRRRDGASGPMADLRAHTPACSASYDLDGDSASRLAAMLEDAAAGRTEKQGPVGNFEVSTTVFADRRWVNLTLDDEFKFDDGNFRLLVEHLLAPVDAQVVARWLRAAVAPRRSFGAAQPPKAPA